MRVILSKKKPEADLVQLCFEMSLPGSYQYQDVFKMLDHRAATWPNAQRPGIGLTLPPESLEGCPGLEYRSDIWLQGLFYVVSSSSLSLLFSLCFLSLSSVFQNFQCFLFFFFFFLYIHLISHLLFSIFSAILIPIEAKKCNSAFLFFTKF